METARISKKYILKLLLAVHSFDFSKITVLSTLDYHYEILNQIISIEVYTKNLS